MTPIQCAGHRAHLRRGAARGDAPTNSNPAGAVEDRGLGGWQGRTTAGRPLLIQHSPMTEPTCPQMSEALIRGFIASGICGPENVMASVRSSARWQAMKSLGVQPVGDALRGGAAEIAASCDIILLGVCTLVGTVSQVKQASLSARCCAADMLYVHAWQADGTTQGHCSRPYGSERTSAPLYRPVLLGAGVGMSQPPGSQQCSADAVSAGQAPDVGWCAGGTCPTRDARPPGRFHCGRGAHCQPGAVFAGRHARGACSPSPVCLS